MKSSKVAIVYDRVNKFGGAERVLLALRELYPDSVLFTSVYDKKGASWVGDWEVRTSWLQHIPFATTRHEWFALLMPWAFSSLNLSQFDLVISVTSEFAKNVATSGSQIHVCYCLTPTRYLWSHTNEYAQGFLSFAKRVAFSFLRTIDIKAARKPDVYFAISELVKHRIETYYHRTVDAVIYPPTNMMAHRGQVSKERASYLVVSRLVPYKRIDLAITACIALSRELIIVGSGSDEGRLRRLAGGNSLIHFEGSVSDERLHELYGHARALLCPQEEDFGLVSIEAQSHGTPVISYAKSGVIETLIDAQTGILFTSQTDQSILKALVKFENMKWDVVRISKHAQSFDQKTFMVRFAREIDRVQLDVGKKKGIV